MAASFITFTGRERLATSFPAIINETSYRCTIKWNLAALRWYLDVYDSAGRRRLTVPLVESGVTAEINLLAGVFENAAILWRADIGKIEIRS